MSIYTKAQVQQCLIVSFMHTCASVIAGLMHFALEELQSHDGIDGDQQKDQQGDVQQRQHGFKDGVHHHLQA